MHAIMPRTRRGLARLVVATLLVVGVPVALATGAQAAPTDSVIAGRLVAPDGTPATDVAVCAHQYTGDLVVCADTATDGSFALTVPPDDYWLELDTLTDSFLVPETWLSAPDTAPAFLVTYPGNTTSIGTYALQLGGSLSGRLLHPDGTPAADVDLDLRNLLVENWQWDYGYATTTSADGSFRFWHLPARAAYTLRGIATADPAVTESGYLVEPGTDTPLGDITLAGPVGTRTATVTVTGGGTTQVGVPATVEVTVSGASGTPTGTVAVSDTAGTGDPVALDETGHATLSFTPDASWTAPTVAYSGDETYRSATSTLTEPQPVPGAPTWFNPGNDDLSTTTGGTFTAEGSGLGTGTTFTFEGDPVAATVNGAGTSASFTLPPHVGGTAWLVATNAAGASDAIAAYYARSDAHPTLTTADPTSTAAAVRTYEVTLTPPAGPTPTGTVTFRVDGGTRHEVPVVDGAASWTTDLGAGVHRVTASYSGDATYLSSAAELQQGATVPPTVTSVSPAVVTPLGGEVLTVTGTGFTDGAVVMIGGNVGSEVVVDSPTSLRVTMPPNNATGAGRVTVRTSSGVSTQDVVVTSQLVPTSVTLAPSVAAPLPGASFTVTATVGAARGVATGGLLTLLVDGTGVAEAPLVAGVATFTTSLSRGIAHAHDDLRRQQHVRRLVGHPHAGHRDGPPHAHGHLAIERLHRGPHLRHAHRQRPHRRDRRHVRVGSEHGRAAGLGHLPAGPGPPARREQRPGRGDHPRRDDHRQRPLHVHRAPDRQRLPAPGCSTSGHGREPGDGLHRGPHLRHRDGCRPDRGVEGLVRQRRLHGRHRGVRHPAVRPGPAARSQHGAGRGHDPRRHVHRDGPLHLRRAATGQELRDPRGLISPRAPSPARPGAAPCPPATAAARRGRRADAAARSAPGAARPTRARPPGRSRAHRARARRRRRPSRRGHRRAPRPRRRRPHRACRAGGPRPATGTP